MHWVILVAPVLVLAILALGIFLILRLFQFGFARYGGCTLPLLQQCMPHTVALRGQAGMLLFGVVSISSVIAGLSWWKITENPVIGMGFGAAWFVLFSLLDRALMSSLDGVSPPLKVDGERLSVKVKRVGLYWSGTLVAYATRIAIVVLSAHINTTVVQGFIFAPEIETVIAKRGGDIVSPAIQKRDEANQVYGKVVTGWNDYLAKLRNRRVEYEQAGDTKVATEIAQTLREKEADYKKIRESGVEAKALAAAEEDLRHARERAAEPVGQADRDAILQQLAEKNPIIKYLYWMIFVVEFAAFIAKILRGKDEYDTKVTRYKEWAKTVGYQPAPPPDNLSDFHDTDFNLADSPQFR